MRQVHAAGGVSKPVLHDSLPPATIQPLRAGCNAVADAKKIDPFDVEALEKSLNDSATRVSTIWISFLIFSLYLLTAATTVTHRQLLLAEPVKLPVLNIDLPLWGFFFLAPALFVIFHVYVLLQVLLLGRTAAAYNEALDRAIKSPPSNAAMRQRLANTLFAQIFAGSPRERGGWLGRLLRAMASITLSIAPILILLTFQFSFLAYHSHIATWAHRLLILVELSAFFLIWPLALDAQKDFQRPKVGADLKRLAIILLRLEAKDKRRNEMLWLRTGAAPFFVCVALALVSLTGGTFPGEPHLNFLSGSPLFSTQCKRWLQQEFTFGDLRFDRLVLPGVHAIEDEKLAKIEGFEIARDVWIPRGERTRNFQGRDLRCGDFESADFRRADFSNAQLVGAQLSFAALGDASFEDAQLQGADLSIADLQGAYLVKANLQRSNLFQTHFEGAWLDSAELQGAHLQFARLQGASLKNADLRGANLDYVQLAGASLEGAKLQGASATKSDFRAVTLINTSLQGITLAESQLDQSLISNANVWHAKGAVCSTAETSNLDFTPKIETSTDQKLASAMSDTIMDFIARSTAGIPGPGTTAAFKNSSKDGDWPNEDRKEAALKRMRLGLLATANEDTDAITRQWQDCAVAFAKIARAEFDKNRAALLRQIACDSERRGKALAEGIFRNWLILVNEQEMDFQSSLANGLFGQDGKKCGSTQYLSQAIVKFLQKIAKLPRTLPQSLPD
jgi:uncharacterized protein YjbI with pentapeptide repeats